MKQRIYLGESLLGLIIVLSLSSLLLLVIMEFYRHSQLQNQDSFMRLHLQNELQRSAQLMGKDLRRAGFRALAEKLTTSNLTLFEQDEQGTSLVITQADNEMKQSCVLFFYDLDATGCIGSTYKSGTCMVEGKNSANTIERELFGYRLNKGMLETRLTYKNSVNANCEQTQCRSYLHQPACNGGGWADLLDESDIYISRLQFQWLINGKLLEIQLAGHLKKHPHIQYETHLVTPLLNQGEFND